MEMIHSIFQSQKDAILSCKVVVQSSLSSGEASTEEHHSEEQQSELHSESNGSSQPEIKPNLSDPMHEQMFMRSNTSAQSAPVLIAQSPPAEDSYINQQGVRFQRADEETESKFQSLSPVDRHINF
jgi:hypothetical protein